MSPGADWLGVVERILEGDRLAFLEFSRFVNGLLIRWNAYDFRDEWDDLIQETVLAVAFAVRDGRLSESRAVPGYVRSVARNKFVDRLKLRIRWRQDESLPWQEAIDAASLDPISLSPEMLRDLLSALEGLPEGMRTAVCGVYLEGKTYREVSIEHSVPLGTLKGHLREGLLRLRDRLLQAGHPIQSGEETVSSERIDALRRRR